MDKRQREQGGSFIFNHFEVIRGICTKTNLIKSLRQYYQSNDAVRMAHYNLFDTTPTTFVFAGAQDEKEIPLFMHRFREIMQGGSNKERTPHKHCVENMWVVKPASLNQGKGIEVMTSARDIVSLVFSKNNNIQYWVVQKYIERPFLYKQRKFDIRVWALVTDDYRIYVYREGYLRTSSTSYDTSNNNQAVHLTN